MLEVLGVILMLLSFALLGLAVVGLINPRWIRNRKTGEIPRRGHILLGGTLLPVVFFVAGGLMLPEGKTNAAESSQDSSASGPTAVTTEATQALATSTQPAQPSPKNLGMTPEEFRKAYNNVAGQVDKSWRVAEFDIEKGDVRDAFNAKLGKAAHIIGAVDKTNGKLIDLMVVVGGGKPEDNLQAIFVMLAAAQVTTQGATKESISKVISSSMKLAMADIDNPEAKPINARVGNREYSITASKLTGLMFSIEALSN